MSVNVVVTINADSADQFAAEWKRVTELLSGPDRATSLVVDADDNVVGEEMKPLEGEIIPPAKKRAGRKAKPFETIEGTAEAPRDNATAAVGTTAALNAEREIPGVKTPYAEPVQTDLDDAIVAKEPASVVSIETIRAKIKAVFEKNGADGASALLKEFGVKNASGVLDTGKAAEFVVKADALLAA